MIISPRQIQTSLFLLGITFLTPALFMAQVFWGVHLSFALFSIFSPNGIVALLLQSISGAIVAAVPFGVLFGLASPTHSWRNATIFAVVPAALIYCFSIWVTIWDSPMSPPHPHLYAQAADALLFIIFFPLFAFIGARLGPRISAANGLGRRYIWHTFGCLLFWFYCLLSVYLHTAGLTRQSI
jgi:hypothetical protein